MERPVIVVTDLLFSVCFTLTKVLSLFNGYLVKALVFLVRLKTFKECNRNCPEHSMKGELVQADPVDRCPTKVKMALCP